MPEIYLPTKETQDLIRGILGNPNPTQAGTATVMEYLKLIEDKPSGSINNQGLKYFENPGTFEFVVPDGVQLMHVSAAGGGGGGGGRNNSNGQSGAGGGSSPFALRVPIIVTPGETLTIKVGAGGAGGAGGSTAAGFDRMQDGETGGSTSVGSRLTITAGTGGGTTENSTPSVGGIRGTLSYTMYDGAPERIMPVPQGNIFVPDFNFGFLNGSNGQNGGATPNGGTVGTISETSVEYPVWMLLKFITLDNVIQLKGSGGRGGYSTGFTSGESGYNGFVLLQWGGI